MIAFFVFSTSGKLKKTGYITNTTIQWSIFGLSLSLVLSFIYFMCKIS